MIRTETIDLFGAQYTHTWSDMGMMIHGGNPESDYVDTLDPIDSGRTYVETNIPIPGEDEPAAAADYEEALSRLGVVSDD